MASACTPIATGTSTFLITTSVLTTEFSTTVSTESPITTTITTTTCAFSSVSDLPCIPVPTVFVTTIPGNVTTETVPFTTTVATTQNTTVTLFGSSCPATSSSVPTSSSTPPPSNTNSQAANGSSLSPSLSTPDPVTYTSQGSTTLGNGQVSAVAETFTSQPAPSTVYVPATPSGLVAQTNNDRSSSQVGPIVGGVLGSILGLIAVVLILWFIMKRRRRWDDIFDKEDDSSHSPGRRPTKRWSLDADMEPKPYQYGLVGQTSSPSLPSLGISSTMESPPPTLASSQLPRTNNTLAPLITPTTVSTPGPSATTLSSRPSTAGSMLPLRDSIAVPVSNHKQTASGGSSTSVQQHISPAMPSHWGHHSPSPSTDETYLDNFERSGSPTSMREWEPQRKLRLANAGDNDSINSPTTAAGSILEGRRDGHGHGRIGSNLSGILIDADS